MKETLSMKETSSMKETLSTKETSSAKETSSTKETLNAKDASSAKDTSSTKDTSNQKDTSSTCNQSEQHTHDENSDKTADNATHTEETVSTTNSGLEFHAIFAQAECLKQKYEQFLTDKSGTIRMEKEFADSQQKIDASELELKESKALMESHLRE